MPFTAKTNHAKGGKTQHETKISYWLFQRWPLSFQSMSFRNQTFPYLFGLNYELRSEKG